MQTVVMIASAVFLMLGSAVFLVSYMKSRNEYDDIIDQLDSKEFGLKSVICAGIFLDEHVKPTRFLPRSLKDMLKKYDSRVASKIVELYGYQNKETFTAAHSGNKWVLSLIAFLFFNVFGLISCTNGSYDTAAVFVLLSPAVLIGMPFLLDSDLNNKIEKRRQQIILDFPDFANKLILLVNAGSTIPKAWEKIVTDSDSNAPLYRELRICSAEIRAGTPEATAYESFGRRCKVKEVVKFVSVIILNLRKGGSEVIPALRAQADECWEARIAAARRLGEQASSKLMLPMTIMLVGIIVIVALPAVLSLSNI